MADEEGLLVDVGGEFDEEALRGCDDALCFLKLTSFFLRPSQSNMSPLEVVRMLGPFGQLLLGKVRLLY